MLLAITNRPASAINNLCGVNTYITPADLEISVASTKGLYFSDFSSLSFSSSDCN